MVYHCLLLRQIAPTNTIPRENKKEKEEEEVPGKSNSSEQGERYHCMRLPGTDSIEKCTNIEGKRKAGRGIH